MARSLGNRYKTDFVKRLVGSFEDKLELEARAFIDKMISGVTYKHQKGNLYDSYGYGIFLDGKLLRSSATDGVRTATEPIKWYQDEHFGFDLMRKTFSDGGYKPSEKKGYVVVFAATAPYTNVLQYGLEHGLSQDYKVIAYMEAAAWEFGKDIAPHLVKDVREGNYQAWNNGAFIPSKYKQA